MKFKFSSKINRWESFFLWPLLLIVSLSLLIVWKVNSEASSYTYDYQKQAPNTDKNIISKLTSLIYSDNKTLSGELGDRINILLLGNGGQGHQGGLLSDTLIIASLKPSTNEIALISIPRDFAVNIPNYGLRKINSVFALYEQKESGQGGPAISRIVSQTTGQPIHYYVQLDFAGFVKIIDALGGLDIVVERSFEDKQYPTSDFGTKTFSVTQGKQHFDGQTALMFARSRHGNNGEGSDFSRSKRQQLIISSAKKELLSLQTIANPRKIKAILKILKTHLSTNLSIWEISNLISIAKKTNSAKITHRVLNNNYHGGPLKSIISDRGSYLLIPRQGNLEEIKSIVNNIFLYGERQREQASITLLNGTNIPGLAIRTASYLKSYDFEVKTMGNAPSNSQQNSDQQQTVIYVHNPQKPNTVSDLVKLLQARQSNYKPQTDANNPSDIIIILGEKILSILPPERKKPEPDLKANPNSETDLKPKPNKPALKPIFITD